MLPMTAAKDSSRSLFPGSFDPVTLGHVDLITRAQVLFGEVTVLVAAEASKEPLFSVDERVELLRTTLAHLTGITISATRGLLVDAAREADAQVVVRGLRGGADLDYETQMAHTNRSLLPALDTVFLLAAPEVSFISSTLVRQIASLGGDVSALVPPAVAAALVQRYSN